MPLKHLVFKRYGLWMSADERSQFEDLSANTTDDPDSFVPGWVSHSNSRGTIIIIWTCLYIVFLCSWTMLCLKYPAKNDTKVSIFLQELRWMNNAILGPEFVLAENAHTWAGKFRASKSWAIHFWPCVMSTSLTWTASSCNPRDSFPFPVNNKHLIWLAQNGYLALPLIDEHEIWDRSKVDMLVKLLNFFKITYLLISVTSRRIQILAITTIELGAVSNATCSLAILFVWMHKPADFMTSIALHIDSCMAEISVAAGDVAKDPYVMTPLGFVDNMGPSWPANVTAFVIVITLFTDGFHLFGWSYRFLTVGEQLAWRIATMIMFVTAAFFWLAEIIAVIKRGQDDRTMALHDLYSQG
ncbi:hypothetical protein Daus18300_004183 [Diaporthe australafricana]|uniref:Integral membrane protein n=1 Tax=Diaporthe australafricana TaxID=127596 RepID=A0ABR3XBC3_9PEZI